MNPLTNGPFRTLPEASTPDETDFAPIDIPLPRWLEHSRSESLQ